MRRRGATPLRVGAAVAAALGFAAPRLRRRLGLPQPVVSALAWQAPLALVLAAPPSKRRAAGIYALQMFAYLAHYEMPADDLDGIQKRTRVRYPIVLDRVLGLGQIPTLRLQRLLWRLGRTAPHDIALSALHWLWYFVPHLAVIYVLVKRPDRFGRAAGVVALTFDLGLIIYWAVPTAPPWWASANGDLEPVERVMLGVGERAFGPAWPPLYDSLSRNPFAAMPSLHFATSLAAARALGEVGPAERRLGLAYASALGFALVYLGEHYVADLLAGLAVVEVAGAIVETPAFRVLEERLGR